jgi:hypothetical protein
MYGYYPLGVSNYYKSHIHLEIRLKQLDPFVPSENI